MDLKVPKCMGDHQAEICGSSILNCPNCEKKFHVHIDMFNLAIGAMLAQNLDNKCDQPITYASRLLSLEKKN